MANTTKTDGTEFRTIQDLVDHDYDGGDNMDEGSARNILKTWCRNSTTAKQMIESRGMERAIAEYRAAWDVAYRAEYNLDGDSE